MLNCSSSWPNVARETTLGKRHNDLTDRPWQRTVFRGTLRLDLLRQLYSADWCGLCYRAQVVSTLGSTTFCSRAATPQARLTPTGLGGNFGSWRLQARIELTSARAKTFRKSRVAIGTARSFNGHRGIRVARFDNRVTGGTLPGLALGTPFHESPATHRAEQSPCGCAVAD